MLEKQCKICGKTIRVHPYRFDEKKYCSQKCQWLGQRRTNKARFVGDGTAYITLTQDQETLVDAEDVARLLRYRWNARWDESSNTFYAVRTRRDGDEGVPRGLHTFLMETPPGMKTDHINGNGLDNRKSNLRICTNAQNSYNRKPSRNGTSRYKGVWFMRDRGYWQAGIRHSGKLIHLGSFQKEEDAARAYNEVAEKLHGEFALLNEVD